MMDENSKLAEPLPARDVMIEAMIASALESAAAAERYGLGHDMIILSAKVCGVRDLLDVYTKLAARCDYPLHLGLTEAGMGSKGLIASTAGLAPLLLAGNRRHDSRLADAQAQRRPHRRGAGRAADSAVALHPQLYAAGHELPRLRPHHEHLLPGAGRADPSYLRTSMPEWRKKYPGVEELKLAVMGCVVNGPGESKHANLGISLPGTFEDPVAPVYIDGKLSTTLRGDTIVAEFKQILDHYVESTTARRQSQANSSAPAELCPATAVTDSAGSSELRCLQLPRSALHGRPPCASPGPPFSRPSFYARPPSRSPQNKSPASPPIKPRKCSTKTFAFPRIFMK